MKRVLVTGASGQIGSELVPALRDRYGADQVVAAWHSKPLSDEIIKSGPTSRVDVTDLSSLEMAVDQFDIDTVYHLSSFLSALAEQERRLSYQVNIMGLGNVLEVDHQRGLERVVIPSSIAAFGPDTPRDNTPNDTIQRPNTLYGISKVFGELLGNYYFEKLGLDVRGVRLPGIISWKVMPTAGTTDYAVAAFYGAIQEKQYTCYLKPGTYLPMMYMPDAIRALIQLAEADISDLRHHADYNVNAFSLAPDQLAEAITIRIPEFRMDYQIDPLRQAIADSWPNSLDDSAARQEWGWQPSFDLDAMVDDMLANLTRKYAGTFHQPRPRLDR
jgi:nucleoside-diphosphate-sugar epimerase